VELDVGTIILGLVDMHVHLVWDGTGDPVATLRAESEQETTLRAAHNARQQLRGGVTTVRDVGSVGDIAINVARAIQDSWIDGPRTYASGRTIIISGGHDPFWGIENAIVAGVDTIEHGNQLDEELLTDLTDANYTYDPTLFVYARIAEGSDGIPRYAQRNAKRVYEQHADAFRAALEMDVRLVAGSDAGSPDVSHPGIHLELQQLVEEGMSETAALKAATLSPALELGRPELGTVRKGTIADLVCFDDDPRTAIEVTHDPSHVIKGGNSSTEPHRHSLTHRYSHSISTLE